MDIRTTQSRSILSSVSGYLEEAGFTHSLSPSRNCTFGCTYCYVPEMRVRAGLQPEDWQNWGRFTTFKANAAALLARQLRPSQRIYCGPLTDPYQPAEAEAPHMPALLEALLIRPPAVFVLQTRGTGVLRDVALLQALAARTKLRISFSVTTDDDGVRRRFEPFCAPIAARLACMQQLVAAGLKVFATLAPLLPCHPQRLAELVIEAGCAGIVIDPLHTRARKPAGATSRPGTFRILTQLDMADWPAHAATSPTNAAIATIAELAASAGLPCAEGPKGFAMLAELSP